jgi:hypothetical protein
MAKLSTRNGKVYKVASFRVEDKKLNEEMQAPDTHYYWKFALRSDGKVMRALASTMTMYNGKKYNNGGNYSFIGVLKEGITIEQFLNYKFGEENVTRINR